MDPGKACGRARSRRCLFSWRIPKKRIYAEGPWQAHSGEKSPARPFKGGAAARAPPRKDGGWSVGDGRDFLGADSNGAGGALLGKLGHPSFPKSTTTGRETQLAARYGRFEARARV